MAPTLLDFVVVGDLERLDYSLVYLSSTSPKVDDDDANAVAQQFTNGRGSGDDVGSRDLGDGISARLKATGHTAGRPHALQDSRAPIRWDIQTLSSYTTTTAAGLDAQIFSFFFY